MEAAAERIAAQREAARKAEEAETAVLRRPPKRNVLTKVGIGATGLLLLAVASLARRPQPPDLAPNCDKPAFALSSPAKQYRPTAFTMVGPAAKRYVLGVNTVGVVRNATGTWGPVALPGKPPDQVLYVRDEPLTGCRRIGVLNFAVPLGEHVVTMYELGDGQSAVEVQQVKVEVVAPDEDDVVVPRPEQP